jgi:hypothetical protein
MNHEIARSMVVLLIVGAFFSIVGCTDSLQAEVNRQDTAAEVCNDSIIGWATSTETLPSGLDGPLEVPSESLTGSQIVPTCSFEGLKGGGLTSAEIHVCSTSPRCAEIFAASDAAIMSRSGVTVATEVVDSHRTYLFDSTTAESVVSMTHKPVDFVDYMGYRGGYAIVVIWQQPLK